MSAPSVVVVTPTYNERENLERHVRRVIALGPAYCLVVVDDNSPDGTARIAEALAAEFPGRVEIVHREVKQGLGPAYVAGLRHALALAPDLIAMMDADLSHDAADLARLVAAAEGAPVVLGSRYVGGGGTPGWPVGRRLLSRVGGRYAALVLGLPLADPTGGFRVVRRGALQKVDLSGMLATGFAFNLELSWRLLGQGAACCEVPIVFRPRATGASKLSLAVVVEGAIVPWRLRFGGRRS